MEYTKIPLKQEQNRVWRTYQGGFLMEKWLGMNGADGDTPEEWIVSTVEARGAGRPAGEGLSMVTWGQEKAVLKDLIEREPQKMLGERIAKKYGDTALLIKLLDASDRLSVQVHPDKAFAKRHLNSDFGKTEGWYILDTREINNEPAFIYLGFREGVTKEIWSQLFHNQDIQGMLDCMHKITVTPGQVYIIKGGLPHAIGPGCFMMEIQEPTDYTMRTEKLTPDGKPMPEVLIHQGVGEDLMLDCFHYEALSLEETRKKYQLVPKLILQSKEYTLTTLIGEDATECFILEKLDVATQAHIPSNGDFYAVVVCEGSGILSNDSIELEVKKGDKLFIPAAAGDCTYQGNMSLLLCRPPL